jgi:hypothetical protein
MTDSPASPPPRRSSGARIAAVVTGSLVGLVAFGLLAAGGGLLWADSQKDDQGYISTHTERFATGTAALATENLDINLDGAGNLLAPDRYGRVKLSVAPRAGKDVFVGIARTTDVSAYLGRTAHATVTDVDYPDFRAHYRTVGGSPGAAPPASRRIWAASAHGAGRQTLTWDVADGNWSVVVMNADGSPGVDAGVRAGAHVAWLDTAGWGSLGGGVVLLLAAGALLYAGLRTPRPPRAGAETPGPLPATV